ncbi:hypothetical protein KR222_007899 [Zaprionus bogoriensis]|nr:hypothetical protein KR222_007899 [Zaprionus bogoriensis]
MQQIYYWFALLCSIIACKLTQCSAKPTYYDLDSYETGYEHRPSYESGNSYTLTYGKPLTSEHLDKLDTGYYYVDNGYIAPVPGSTKSQQRSLSTSYGEDGYRFAPVVRYRSTRTKRKKLFVPNFFG